MMKMEGENWDRIWMKITVTVLFVFVIFSQGGLFNLEIAADSSSRSTRGSEELEWIQTTQEDFENGTIEIPDEYNNTEPPLDITSTGEVKLGFESEIVWDQFLDESKISYKNNVIVDTGAREVSLLTHDGVIFNKTFGRNLEEHINSVQQTSDGGYILGGYTGYDYLINVWLIKTDSMGNEIWNNTFDRNFNDKGFSVQQTSDDGYIIVGSTYIENNGWDVYLIKTDSLGNEEWNKTYGDSVSPDDWGRSVLETSDNGYIITGWTWSYGASRRDIWLIKTDSFGNEQWNKTLGGSDDDEPGEGSSIQITSDGGYIIVGGTDSYGGGTKEVWLIKTDNLGIEQWNKTFGGSSHDMGHSVQTTSDGGYILIGLTNSYGSGNEDIWLIKTNSTGSVQWWKTFGGSSSDRGYSVQVTSDGGYILCGKTNSYSMGRSDGWLIITNSTGIEQWNKNYGGSNSENFYDVQKTSDNNYAAVGTKSNGSGNRDAWLLKIYAQENIPHTSGELTSTNLLNSLDVHLIDSFRCDAYIPSETGLSVQFSQDNYSWFDSQGNPNSWDILSDGVNQISLSPLAWFGPNLYYKMNFTSNNSDSPILDLISLSYSRYLPSATFLSQSFDSNTFPAWKYLNWSAQVPSGTELRFQLRTGDTRENSMNTPFIGPDGSSSTYYTSSGQSIFTGHERDRWLQYKIYFSTTNLSITPELEEVKITYIPIDTDNDDIPDFEDIDDDNDEIPDTWEVEYNLDPLNNSDATIDADLDGLTNLQEYLNYSKPNITDTDGDNLGDGFEVIFSKTNASLWDTNRNGIGDGLEFIESQGYLGWIEILPDNWIGMTISWDNYTVYIKTNSSVLEGEFDRHEQELKIKVSGPEGTSGVTEIDVPKSLCEPDDIEIMLDGELINYTITEDDTYYYIHVEYNHSTHELTADFTRIIDEPIESEDDEVGLPVQYLIILVVVIILTTIILLGITRTRNGFRNNDIPDLPPDELSKILEDKYAGGEMTDETYNDIKSILEKYEDSDDSQ
jgi:hypothetical protein